MNKQLLILPDGKSFTQKQTKELRDAGFIVVHLPDPKEARLINAETLPFSSSDVLHIALKALRQADNTYAYRSLVEGLAAACKPAPGE
jgi:hypothetical protein